MTYLLKGSWIDSGCLEGQAVYALRVQSRGDHCGDSPLLRKDRQGSATKLQQRNVVEVAGKLAQAGALKAGEFMQELCGAGKEYPPSTSLRGQLRRLSKAFGIPPAKRVPGRKAKGCATWSKPLEEKMEELATDPNLRVVKLSHDRTVVSFMVVFESMWKFLEDLHREGVLEFLCVGADHAFQVEWQGYTWGIVGAVLHRCIAGNWRKPFIPLCAVCRPREWKANYKELFR